MIAIVLAYLGVAAATYEWWAVRTQRTPTITALVKAAGWPTRILVATVGAWAIVDHFAWDGGIL